MTRSSSIAYFRNFVFGVEDSLVSTVGLLSGVAIAGLSRQDIFLTGLILIFVEAISMAAGSFLSESSAEEYASHSKAKSKRSVMSALVMLVSYFVSGFIPLAPYLFFSGSFAFWLSIVVSIMALLGLGVLGGSLSKTSRIAGAFRMCMIGGLAIIVGVAVGKWLG